MTWARMHELDLSADLMVTLACSGSVLTLFVVAIYRVWFHTLARFPGPKKAALSNLYIFYHNVIRRCRFPLVAIDLHDKYGPIVRIAPNELHVRSPQGYKSLGKIKAHKEPGYYDIGLGQALALMSDGSEHLRRRTQLITTINASMGIVEMELPGKILQMRSLIRNLARKGECTNLSHIVRSFALDITHLIFFGQAENFLADENQAHEVHMTSRALFRYWDFIRQFPFLVRMQDYCPALISHAVAPVLKYESLLARKIDRFVASIDAGDDKSTRAAMIHTLAKDSSYRENNNKDLVSEAMETAGGSSEALAYAILHITRLLMEHPNELELLRQEIDEHVPDPLECSHATLHKLVYLKAVIKEADRLQYAGSYRFPRVIDQDLTIEGVVIPAGTIVTFTQVVSHRDPNAFANPDKFIPQRWLGAQSTESEAIMSLGHGHHQCLGIKLISRVLLRTVACVVKDFDFAFVDNVPESREKDGFSEFFPPRTSKGLLVHTSLRN